MAAPSLSSTCPLVIVGAGTAGRAAASAAASCGLPSLWIDDAAQWSGEGNTIAIARDARVLNISNDLEIFWATATKSGTFRADRIILATGSEPRTVPFPGWTLPGVNVGDGTTGLVEPEPVRATGRVLVAGAGPLLWERAVGLLDKGWTVVAVLDAAGPVDREESHRHNMISKLREADVSVLYHHTIFAASGTDHVRRATFGPVDPDEWSPQFEQRTTIDVNRVVLEFGRVANNDLAELSGCRLAFDNLTDSWMPVRDERMRTSVSGIFSVNGSGVAYEMLAGLEGRIAGISAAEEAGVIDPREANDRLAPLFDRLANVTRRRDELERTCRIQAGLDALMKEETIICRCEEVPLGAIAAAVATGVGDMSSLKLMTRLGMGACQGKACGATGSRILTALVDQSRENTGRIHARPPARPVTLGALARMSRGTSPEALDGVRHR